MRHESDHRLDRRVGCLKRKQMVLSSEGVATSVRDAGVDEGRADQTGAHTVAGNAALSYSGCELRGSTGRRIHRARNRR